MVLAVLLRWRLTVGTLLAAVLIGRSGFPLPYPCRGTVESVPAHRLPTPRPLEGSYKPNTVLQKNTRLFDGLLQGPESVHVDSSETIHTVDKYGNYFVSKLDSTGEYSELQKVAFLGPSRPLGFTFDQDHNMIICDATIGLTMLEKATGKLIVLANQVSEDSPLSPSITISYANDLDIAKDGTIYFTSSTEKPVVPNVELGFYDTFKIYLLEIMQGSMTGRLLSHTPKTGKTHVLTEGFWYTNGVAVAPDQSFVAFAETNTMTVHKYWLKGPKRGTVTELISGLPGFPDGVSLAQDGNFWITLAAPGHQPLVKLIPYKWVRYILAWLPASLKPPPKLWGAVVKVTADGEVKQFLLDPEGSHVSAVSSVFEYKDRLYFGNVAGNYASYLDKSQIPVELRG